MINKLLFVIFFSLSINSSFALQKIFAFHINGINTTQTEAMRNVDKLNEFVDVHSNMIARNGHIDLLYNKEDGDSFCSLCKQLADVWSQKHYENLSIDDYVIAYIKDQNLNIQAGTPEYNALKNSIKEKYFANPSFMGNNFADILAQFQQKTTIKIETKYLLDFLKANSTNDAKSPFILLIPHSQGNLYANNLYKELVNNEGYNQSNLSIYGIASPSASNLGSYISKTAYNNPGYITSANDVVINGLRIFAAIPPQQSILPSNVTIPAGHELISVYLANESSKVQIVNNIYNILHYFWLSDLYANFTQTINGGVRILNDDITFVATEPSDSTLFIQGFMVNGSCPEAQYFEVRDNVYDNELGRGTQCAAIQHGIYFLTSRNYYNSNILKIKFAYPGRRLSKMNLKCNFQINGDEPHWENDIDWILIEDSFYSGIIGSKQDDQSCEKLNRFDYPIYPTKGDLFKGILGRVII